MRSFVHAGTPGGTPGAEPTKLGGAATECMQGVQIEQSATAG